jgi:hypothetical protein
MMINEKQIRTTHESELLSERRDLMGERLDLVRGGLLLH